MRPRGKLFALLAIFAAIGLITATGAFTTVAASRTATVNVAGDGQALLGLEPYQGPNGYGPSIDSSAAKDNSYGYAQLNGGQLEINLAGFHNNNIGQGVNLNATTKLDHVFNISNQGTQTVSVSIEKTGANNGTVGFHKGISSGARLDEGNSQTLTSGQTIPVSIVIDTTGHPGLGTTDELLSSITINATATP